MVKILHLHLGTKGMKEPVLVQRKQKHHVLIFHDTVKSRSSAGLQFFKKKKFQGKGTVLNY